MSPVPAATRSRPRAWSSTWSSATPFSIPATPWPRRKQDVAKASLELREHLIAHLDDAKALTGRTLPGPLPANDADDPDPATGVTDQEAM